MEKVKECVSCVSTPCITFVLQHTCLSLIYDRRYISLGQEEAPCVFGFSQLFTCRSRGPCVIWSMHARLDETSGEPIQHAHLCRTGAHEVISGAAADPTQAASYRSSTARNTTPNPDLEGSSPMRVDALGAPSPHGLQRQFSDSANSLRAQAALGATKLAGSGSGLGVGLAIPAPRARGEASSLPNLRLLGGAPGAGVSAAGGASLGSQAGRLARCTEGALLEDAEEGAGPRGAEGATEGGHEGTTAGYLAPRRSLSLNSEPGMGRRTPQVPGGTQGGGVPEYKWAVPPKFEADGGRQAGDAGGPAVADGLQLARLTSMQVRPCG